MGVREEQINDVSNHSTGIHDKSNEEEKICFKLNSFITKNDMCVKNQVQVKNQNSKAVSTAHLTLPATGDKSSTEEFSS